MKTIVLDSEGRIMLKQFEGLIDISSVAYYSIKKNKDKSLTLKFYDKKRKLVKPNGK